MFHNIYTPGYHNCFRCKDYSCFYNQQYIQITDINRGRKWLTESESSSVKLVELNLENTLKNYMPMDFTDPLRTNILL